jgi:uncharacterized membrane protein
MEKTRLEMFSDGVIAILITIMVLELHAPHGTDWHALRPLLAPFLAYILSFAYLGIYWNNHHHMLHMSHHVDGVILLANMHLLFWLSLIPFVTSWMTENGLAALPTAVYGTVLLLAAIAYSILQSAIIKHGGPNKQLKEAVGKDVKGKISLLLYAVAIPLAFVQEWIAIVIYVGVALLWLVPDRRIERYLPHEH